MKTSQSSRAKPWRSWGEICERVKRRLGKNGINCVAVDFHASDFGFFCIMIEVAKGRRKCRMPALIHPEDIERDIRLYIRFFKKHKADLFPKL